MTPGQFSRLSDDGILEVKDLLLEAPFGPVLRGLDLRLERGEVGGLVGESGCGKTMLARALLGLTPRGWILKGQARLGDLDLIRNPAVARGRGLSLVPQEPAMALNPYLPVRDQIAEAAPGVLAPAALLGFLEEAGVPDPDRVASAYPHQLSGGLKQRVLIATALAGNPGVLIADEPTTALDPTVAARTLSHLKGLAGKRGLSVLLITHDLPAARSVCSRIFVMYAGRVVEQGPSEALFLRPRHPYSLALARARDGRMAPLESPRLAGTPPLRGNFPRGCAFHPRCDRAQALCEAQDPALTTQELASFRCHFPLEKRPHL